MTINGRVYKEAEIDFGCIAEMQRNGIDISDVENKGLLAIAAYVAYSMKKSLEFAYNEINRHIINGGSLDEIATVFGKKLESSDFFQALKKKAEENPQTDQPEQ